MMMKIEVKQQLGLQQNEEEEEYENVSLLDESDIEKYQGDVDEEEEDGESELSFFGEDDEFKQPDWMHNSFTGGYANIDDIHMDKGKTSQFDGLLS